MAPLATNGNRKSGLPWVKWVVVATIGLGIGFWTGSLQRERAYEKGKELTRQVTAIVADARTAKQDGDYDQAAEKLTLAIEELRASEEALTQPAYVTLLTDLAALRLAQPDRSFRAVDQCHALLEEAWELSKTMDTALRGRIARERGMLEVFRGDLDRAEHWFRQAVRLDPEDRKGHERLELLEQAKGWDALDE